MNIFAMYESTILNAQSLDDRRLNKLMIEMSQMISTAFDRHQLWNPTMCAPAFANHPCTRWVGDSICNLAWAISSYESMHYEWTKIRGFNRHINFFTYIASFDKNYSSLPLSMSVKPTPFANCASNLELGISFKHIEDVNLAYRMYYSARIKKDEADGKILRWTNRSRPEFINYLGKEL